MDRLTGDLVLEIRTFLDHESFYRWILACHVVTLDSNDDSSTMKAGRPMIQQWLSNYVDFPISKIQFGGTQGYQRLLETGGLSTNPKWLFSSATSTYDRELPAWCDKFSIPGPNYFLDIISDNLDHGLDRSTSFNKEAHWFEEVIPSTCEVLRCDKWFETNKKYYSYWTKLWFATEKILTDAIVHNEYVRNDCLKQFHLLMGLERQGCVQFPPHDQMFSIPSVLVRACLDHDELMTSFTTKSITNCKLANSLTILDMMTGESHGKRWSYWGKKVPRWELVRDDSDDQLLLQWSVHEPSLNGDGDIEINQDNGDVEYGYIPLCGSTETSDETQASWTLLQREICRWIDNRLEEFNHELDEELTETIVSALILSDDQGDNIDGDDLDDGDDGEAFMEHLKAKENEASNWADNKKIKVKRRVQRAKKLTKEGLTGWKKYFAGKMKNKQQRRRANLSNQTSQDQEQEFATWQRIGLSDRRCLRFDPVKFNDWMSKTIPSVNQSLEAGGAFYGPLPDLHPTLTVSQSAISLLQFAAEDLGLGLSWRIEGADGEVAVMLLGPHGSLWVKQKDRTILEHFCGSDDDESYCSERSENSSSLAAEDDKSVQDDPTDESSGEPAAKKQKLTTSVSPDRIPAPNDLQQTLLDKMEAIESTLKAEVANLKATNADLKAELKTQLESVKQEMKTTDENQACEIQILKADLHQTRLELAKAQQQLAKKQAGKHEESHAIESSSALA